MVPEIDRIQAFRNEVIRLLNQTEDIVTFGKALRVLREKERDIHGQSPITKVEFEERIQRSREQLEKGLYYTSDEVRKLFLHRSPRKRIQLMEMKTKWRQNRNPFRF